MNHVPALRPEEILGRADLSLRETAQGGQSRWVRQAEIVYGRPVVYLNALDSFPASFRRRPDAGSWRYATVVFPLDLERPPARIHYVSATLRVRLKHAEALALNLEPVGLTGGSAGQAHVDAPEHGWPRRPRAQLQVTVAGLGRSTFWWHLEEAEGGALPIGGHVVRAVLQFPPALATLTGQIGATASLRQNILGNIDELDVQTPQARPFSVPLVAAGEEGP